MQKYMHLKIQIYTKKNMYSKISKKHIFYVNYQFKLVNYIERYTYTGKTFI